MYAHVDQPLDLRSLLGLSHLVGQHGREDRVLQDQLQHELVTAAAMSAPGSQSRLAN